MGAILLHDGFVPVKKSRNMTSGKQHALRVETSRPWLLAGLFWFILIVVLGILMRLSLAFDAPLPGAFEWVRHAHSHTAFWGWAGSAFTGIMLSGLSSGRHSDVRFERRLFLATQCCTAGALFSFISSGYSAVSIVFSALHVGLWFVLAIHVRRRGFSDMLASATRQLMLLALVCLLVAALPTFFLPVSVATGMGGPLLKKMAIEFFRHNYSEGWLRLIAFALLLELANPAPVISIPAVLALLLRVTGAFRGVCVISAPSSLTAADTKCQFSVTTGTSRLPFRRNFCRLCNTLAPLYGCVKNSSLTACP